MKFCLRGEPNGPTTLVPPMTNMPSARLLSVAHASPPHTRTTSELLPLVTLWLHGQPERFREKVLRLFKYSGVERRYSIFSPEEVFTPMSFAARNRIYMERLLPLAEQAIQAAASKARTRLSEFDAIVSTSCTGICIPGLDAALINRLALRQDILRLPVFQMGCAGGVAGLVYAQSLLRSGTCKRVLLLALESPVTTLQVDDFSMANMVSAAIFGDGVAAAVLSNHNTLPEPVPELVDSGMYHFPDTTRLMGFDQVESGLQMVLAPEVPATILQHLESIILPFLSRNELTPAQVTQFLFHPGGRKILQSVDEWLSAFGKSVPLSHQVLRDHGNMSSATILYILEQALAGEHTPGESAFVLSFGPGFTAQRALLRWST
jgi:alkylresorcinol/alkylpyrone synthase